MTQIDLSFRHDLPSVTGGHRVKSHFVASTEDSDYVLRHLLEQLGITPYVLGRLTGKGPINVYSWFSARSPSQAYWVRIAHLVALVQSGLNLSRVRTIDWSKPPYAIEWWPGAEPEAAGGEHDSQRGPKGNDTVRNAWGDIPSPDGDHHLGRADGPPQPPVH